MDLRRFFAAIPLLAVMALPAGAADYPRYKPFEFRPTIHDWTGGYAGVHAGWGWGDHEARFPGIPPLVATTSTDGLVAGVQAGYRSQDEGYVWGIEADVSFLDHSIREVLGPLDFRADMNWAGSLRLVAGVPIDELLLYATGGLAASRLAASEKFTGWDHNKYLWGWVAGLGAEAGLSPSWSARAEWLYYDFGKTDHASAGIDWTTEHSFHVLRAGLNYRFAGR
jgi:outer membrane immunogenic protein